MRVNSSKNSTINIAKITRGKFEILQTFFKMQGNPFVIFFPLSSFRFFIPGVESKDCGDEVVRG